MTEPSSRENFFILLGIDPDQPWSDKDFEQRLSEKRAEWTRQANHPQSTVKLTAKRNLNWLSDVKIVMTDPAKRERERLAARNEIADRKRKALARLGEYLDLQASRGYLLSDEIREIIAVFVKDGTLSEADIRQEIQQRNIPEKHGGTLDPSIAKEIQARLQILGKKDLYDFLDLPNHKHIAELRSRANDIYRASATSTKSDVSFVAKKDLAGFALAVFVDEQSKQGYDNFLANEPLEELGSLLHNITKIDKRIHPNQYRKLLEYASRQGISEERASVYIRQLAQRDGLQLEIGTEPEARKRVRCGACGHMNDDQQFCGKCGASLRPVPPPPPKKPAPPPVTHRKEPADRIWMWFVGIIIVVLIVLNSLPRNNQNSSVPTPTSVQVARIPAATNTASRTPTMVPSPTPSIAVQIISAIRANDPDEAARLTAQVRSVGYYPNYEPEMPWLTITTLFNYLAEVYTGQHVDEDRNLWDAWHAALCRAEWAPQIADIDLAETYVTALSRMAPEYIDPCLERSLAKVTPESTVTNTPTALPTATLTLRSQIEVAYAVYDLDETARLLASDGVTSRDIPDRKWDIFNALAQELTGVGETDRNAWRRIFREEDWGRDDSRFDQLRAERYLAALAAIARDGNETVMADYLMRPSQLTLAMGVHSPEPTRTNTTQESHTDSSSPGLAPEQIPQNESWQPVIAEFDETLMALVPPGCFVMGSQRRGADEGPEHDVCFEEPFWIDVTEVTNEQYGSSGRWSGSNRPRERVTWREASDFCAARGARLPTEAEWEYAARGPDGRMWPGTATAAIFGTSQTFRVGSQTAGASWVGALDMSGNVWEWVTDFYGDYPSESQINPQGRMTGTQRVLRGGSWAGNTIDDIRTTVRYPAYPSEVDSSFGFRCALSDSSYRSSDPQVEASIPTPAPMAAASPMRTEVARLIEITETAVLTPDQVERVSVQADSSAPPVDRAALRITAHPPYDRQEAARLYTSIWSLAEFQDIESPGEVTYKIEVDADRSYRLAFLWCADSASRLRRILEPLSLEILVDDIPLSNTQVSESGLDETCKIWESILDGWVPDAEYEVVIHYALSERIFDGEKKYEAGDYFHRITVHAR